MASHSVARAWSSCQCNVQPTGDMQHIQARQDVPVRQVLPLRPRHQRAPALPLRARFKQNVRGGNAPTGTQRHRRPHAIAICRQLVVQWRSAVAFQQTASVVNRIIMLSNVYAFYLQHLLRVVVPQRAGATPQSHELAHNHPACCSRGFRGVATFSLVILYY